LEICFIPKNTSKENPLEKLNHKIDDLENCIKELTKVIGSYEKKGYQVSENVEQDYLK
jgi:exonuclease VII small subunit